MSKDGVPAAREWVRTLWAGWGLGPAEEASVTVWQSHKQRCGQAPCDGSLDKQEKPQDTTRAGKATR